MTTTDVLSPGDRVRVRGRRGVWKLIKPIPGGWDVLSPQHRIHVVRDNDIRRDTR